MDTSNPSEARHRVPPAVSGSYHETAAYFGDIVQQATHSALQPALLTERQNLTQGMKASESLDLASIEEHVGLLSGRSIAKNWHWDSALAPSLAALASSAGPPSVFTTDLNTGAVYMMPTCSK